MTDQTLGRPRLSGVATHNAASAASFRAFVTRLHFYVGLFVAPFILVAAVTGLLYVLTPQLEDYLYQAQLRTESAGPARSLADQAQAARQYVGEAPTLFAVRPAIAQGHTTRIMYLEPGMAPSESRGIFVDPVTLEIRGDLTVYGTSGTLPFRTAIDYVHRDLLLGSAGRFYSELAASWLLIATLGGVMLWWWRRRAQRPAASLNANLRARRSHGQIGIVIALGLVFIAVTGLTWSEHAGGRISDFRKAVGWITPSVSPLLTDHQASARDDHAHHAPVAIEADSAINHSQNLDQVEAAVRAAGLASPSIEIQMPRSEDRGWFIREYDRQWPTAVDSAVVDPATLQVIARTDFWGFPLVAKLIRWGIDLHMGILFGIASQILMAAIALSLIVTILYGYRIWWTRRPAPGAGAQTLTQSWSYLSPTFKCGTVIATVLAGWAMPMIAFSLLAFLAVDIIRWRLAASQRSARRR